MSDAATANRQLRPMDTVQKMLISTTSRMTGEYENDGLLITHAWPPLQSRASAMRLTETHMSRSGYVIAFETLPIGKKPGVVVPNYAPTGEIITAYLSVLFGKRFDCHGLFEGSGFYQIPEFGSYDTPCNPKLPFNSHATRRCFSVPLEISQFSMIQATVASSANEPDLTRANAACKFYMQALQNAEHNAEVAYLHLITTGEIVSGGFRYRDAKGVKGKFVKALCSLLDGGFYLVSGTDSALRMFDPNRIEQSVGAAYDLRSRYVHTGAPFGIWVDPTMHIADGDLQVGMPVVKDKDLGRVLAEAPTFLGLERLVRYCILKWMASLGLVDRDANA